MLTKLLRAFVSNSAIHSMCDLRWRYVKLWWLWEGQISSFCDDNVWTKHRIHGKRSTVRWFHFHKDVHLVAETSVSVFRGSFFTFCRKYVWIDSRINYYLSLFLR